MIEESRGSYCGRHSSIDSSSDRAKHIDLSLSLCGDVDRHHMSIVVLLRVAYDPCLPERVRVKHFGGLLAECDKFERWCVGE